MLNKKSLQKAINFSNKVYSRLLEEFKDEHHVVGQTEKSHLLRLTKTLELGNFFNKKILDIGCGLGAFYQCLKDRGIEVDYYGIDINPHLIANCKEKYPEIADNFTVFDITTEDMGMKFDFVVAIGVIGLHLGEGINMKIAELLINQVDKHATIGYAIGMTSFLTRRPSPDTFYFKPEELLKIITKKCNNFRLDHTYLPHDFTFFCYKNDFYSNNN